MTKEKLYQKVQALFPSELAVGDVLIDSKGFKHKILERAGVEDFRCSGGEIISTGYTKLFRKNITLNMVLEALKKKDVLFFIGYGYTDGKSTMLTIESSAARWQLRKDGKDLSLYDQSIELIKLVYEVLS